jgi:hypothetical protein
MRVFTVLKSGGQYKPEHVQWFQRMITEKCSAEFVCLSDMKVPGVEIIPLKRNWPGWWSKIELFQYSDVLYFDLDTVIINNIDYMLDLKGFNALRNPTSKRSMIAQMGMASGIMAWDHPPQGVYEGFDTRLIPQYNTRKAWGDQGYIATKTRYTPLQDTFPGRIKSYKYELMNKEKPNCDIVVYHGRPKPWDTKHKWLPNL